MCWVATHRIHHQFSDKEGDPHTPRDGKWWSHIGWMLIGDATHCNVDQCSPYAPDIRPRPGTGLAWYEIDLSWWAIRLLQTIGLATSVRRASLTFKLSPSAGRSVIQKDDLLAASIKANA